MDNYCIVCGNKLPEDSQLPDPCAFFDANRVAKKGHTGLFTCNSECNDEWFRRPLDLRNKTITDMGATPL